MAVKPLGYSPSGTAANVDLDVLATAVLNAEGNAATALATANAAAADAAEALDAFPQTDGRTVDSLPDYLANNAVLNVMDYGAAGDGVADDTVAVQLAVTSLAAGERLLLPAGKTFLISTNITKSGVADLTIEATGATISAPDSALTKVFSFTNCARLNWDGGYFLGTEDNTYFQANTPSDERSFIDLDTCLRASVRNIRGKNKRRLLTAESCDYLRVDGYTMEGFFQNLSLGAVANANWAPSVTIRACDYSHISRGVANNCGSICLGQLSSEHVTVDQMTGHDLHDNGVYCSSGFDWTISNVSVEWCQGNAVQTRGANMTVTNVAGQNFPADYVVDMTGLGLSQDAFGADADGYNLNASNITGRACFGIVDVGANTYYPRDITIRGVTGYASTGTGANFPPIQIAARTGVRLSDVVLRTVAADMGVAVLGEGSSDPLTNVTISGVQVYDVNGSAANTRGGIRLNNVQDFSVIGCDFGDIASTIGVRVLGGDGGIVANNHYDAAQVVRIPSGESNANILVIGNRGTSLFMDPAAVTPRDNIGYVTETNGTATVANGATTSVVTHGLAQTPALQDISITPTNSMGNSTKFFISTPTSTQFTINVDVDPGATTATFVWTASIQ